MTGPHQLTVGTWIGKWVLVTDSAASKTQSASVGTRRAAGAFGEYWMGDEWSAQSHFAMKFDSRAEALSYLAVNEVRM